MTQAIVPDTYLFNAALDTLQGEVNKSTALMLLKMEFYIRKMGCKPSDFQQENLKKILRLMNNFNLDFDKSERLLSLFTVRNQEKLSLWPILTPGALTHVLTQVMGEAVNITTVFAKNGHPIVNNTPEVVGVNLNDSSGLISTLTSSDIAVVASISSEEVNTFLANIDKATLNDDLFAQAVCSKRLLKLIPANNHKEFIDLQMILDTGFIKAYRNPA